MKPALLVLLLTIPFAFARGASDTHSSEGSILLQQYLEAETQTVTNPTIWATVESFVGDYGRAAATYRSITENMRAVHAQPIPADAQAVPVSKIVEAATGKRLVLLNEAHILARTRTVTLQLLPALRQDGFGILALEGLDPTPDDLNVRGFPLETSGPYLKEPVFAELVRTAIELGFKVVPYEASSGQGLTPEKREQAQFENLSKILDANPSSRVVVHAGYCHICKSGNIEDTATLMQRLLKKVPATSMLVIDQTLMTEDSSQARGAYQSGLEKSNSPNPFVIQHGDGRFYTAVPEKFDISVFFPPETVESGRPSWLDLNGTRSPRPVSSAVCDGVFPCLVEAHYSTELERAVAADRFLFTGPTQEVLMYTRRRPVTFSVTTNAGTHAIPEPETLSPYNLPF